jgi:hypothetical protein
MEFDGVTYQGAAIDDRETFDGLPGPLREVLEQVNGLIAYGGGLHLRGAVLEPAWHSLRVARGLLARYPELRVDDVAFAQDAVGDQWVLREGRVLKLWAETGEVEDLGLDLPGFFAAVRDDPIETLGLQPLLSFDRPLEPGQLLNVYPPFCTEESAEGRVSLAAVPADERLQFLAELARQLRELPAGSAFEIKFT